MPAGMASKHGQALKKVKLNLHDNTNSTEILKSEYTNMF